MGFYFLHYMEIGRRQTMRKRTLTKIKTKTIGTQKTTTKALSLSVCILVGLATLSGCSEKESAETYIAQARQSQQESKANESIIALKNAIKIAPTNGEARFLLGDVYLNQGNAVNAVKELEKAKENRHNFDTTIPLLSRAYFLNEQNEEVIELSNEVTALTKESANQYWLYHMLSQLKLDAPKKAKNALTKAKLIDEKSAVSLLASAYFAFYEKELETAESLVNESLAKVPNYPESLLLLGNVAGVLEKYTIASDSYRKYLLVQPEQRTAELLLANALLKDGQTEEAEKHADNILALLPQQPYANYVKAMVRNQEKDYENASKHAEIAIQNKFNQPNLKIVAGTSAFYLKKYEQVLLHLKPLLPYLPEEHFARRMIVVSQLELGIVEDVVDTLGESSSAQAQNSEFNSILSYKLLQAGAQEQAKALLDKSMRDSDDPSQLMRDGVLKMMVNDESAVESLEKAVALDPKLVKAELAIAYIALKEGDYKKANAIAKKWQANYPDKADGLNLESAIVLKQKNINLAKALLHQALSIEPQNIYSLQQLSRISIAEKDNESAIKYIEQAIETAPSNPKVLRQYFDLKRDDNALAFVKQQAIENTDNVNLKLVYAEAFLQSNKVDEVLRELNSLKPTNQTPKLYWQLKLTSYRAQQNLSLLQTTLEDWRKINPYHIEPVVYLADVHVIKKDYDAAIRVVNAGLLEQQDNLTLQLVKLQVLISAQKVNDAQTLYATIGKKIQNPIMKQGIEERIALLNKNYQQAAQQLGPFYQNSPTVKNAVYFVASLVGNNQRNEAIKVLEQHTQKESNAQLLSLLGSLYLETNNMAQAAKVYKNLAEENPRNVVALNNSAWLYMEQGEFTIANELIEKAVELAPDSPDILDTQAQILMKMGKLKEALGKATLAYQKSNESNPDITLNYVELLVLNDRKSRAQKVIANIQTSSEAQVIKKRRLEAMIK